MKTAVIYYSLEGNTRYLAEKIASAKGADLIELVPVETYPDKGFKKFLWGGKAAVMKDQPQLKPYSFDAGLYDTVVLCSPVWAGTMAPPLRTFLNTHNLSDKKIAIAATSAGGNAVKCIKQLFELSKSSSLIAELSIIDPKSKPSDNKNAAIDDFINSIN
jgi:flavodoxin